MYYPLHNMEKSVKMGSRPQCTVWKASTPLCQKGLGTYSNFSHLLHTQNAFFCSHIKSTPIFLFYYFTLSLSFRNSVYLMIYQNPPIHLDAWSLGCNQIHRFMCKFQFPIIFFKLVIPLCGELVGPRRNEDWEWNSLPFFL